MTILNMLSVTFMAALTMDAGLWQLFLQAPRHSNRGRILLRAALTVFIAPPMILLIILTTPNWWQSQVPAGLLVPVMFLLVILITFASGIIRVAISTLIHPRD